MDDARFCPRCGAARVAGWTHCGGCGRAWTATPSASVATSSPWARRIAILVVLFFLSLPGWIVGGYLLLKWGGLIRGMAPENERASAWAIAGFTVGLLATVTVLLIASPRGTPSASVGADNGLLIWGVALAAGVASFLLVKANGAPQLVRNPDWRGVVIGIVIAFVGISITSSSYESASERGGSYVITWGAILTGLLMVLRSLRRPDPAPLQVPAWATTPAPPPARPVMDPAATAAATAPAYTGEWRILESGLLGFSDGDDVEVSIAGSTLTLARLADPVDVEDTHVPLAGLAVTGNGSDVELSAEGRLLARLEWFDGDDGDRLAAAIRRGQRA